MTPPRTPPEASAGPDETLAFVAEALPAAVCLVTRRLEFRFANRAFRALFGSGRDDLRGLAAVDVFGAETIAAITPHLDEAFTGRQVHYELRASREGDVWRVPPRPGAATRTFSVTIVPRRAHGKAVEALCLIQDVTEAARLDQLRQDLETRLRERQSLEAIGTLAAGIAHEFNNLLTPIQSLTAIVRDGMPHDSEDWDRLDLVRQAAERAKHLVQQILLYGRPWSQDEPPSTFDVADLVSQIVRFLRPTTRMRITVEEELPPDPARVNCAKGRLHQVFLNLAVNAIDAMPNGGKLGFRTRVEPGADRVRVEVEDSGTGIPAEVQARMWDPFFSTKEPGTGTGLGLAVVRAIVEEVGGTIVCRSRPGEGSTFVVELPRAQVHAPARQPARPAPSIPRPGLRVLYVEDERLVREPGTLMLRALGCEVTATEDPREALAALRAGPDDFDLVVTDLSMPHLSGARLVAEIRILRPDLPIVISSGASEAETPAGILTVLRKPFGLEDVSAALATVGAGITGPASGPGPRDL